MRKKHGKNSLSVPKWRQGFTIGANGCVLVGMVEQLFNDHVRSGSDKATRQNPTSIVYKAYYQVQASLLNVTVYTNITLLVTSGVVRIERERGVSLISAVLVVSNISSSEVRK